VDRISNCATRTLSYLWVLLLLLTLSACGGGGSGGDDSDDSAPTIDANSGFSPASAVVGGASFTLTITGTGFNSDSVVRWNGADRTTTYVSSTSLTIEVTAADIAGVGMVDITVFNPGGSESTVATFVIGYPVPTVSGLTPNVMQVGSAGFDLTVNGTNFVSGASVRWNGADRTTTYVSDTELTATIPASDVAALGAVTVSVLNPTPGGGESVTNLTFMVNPLPAPTTTGINPASVLVGGPTFSLTVNGTDFIDGNSQIFWNGAGQTTTFVTDTELTAMISSASIASAGMAQITVVTVDGGGSNAQTLMINNPVPTAGHWNILDIYSPGKKVSHVSTE